MGAAGTSVSRSTHIAVEARGKMIKTKGGMRSLSSEH